MKWISKLWLARQLKIKSVASPHFEVATTEVATIEVATIYINVQNKFFLAISEQKAPKVHVQNEKRKYSVSETALEL
jgi:hypothetical protein